MTSHDYKKVFRYQRALIAGQQLRDVLGSYTDNTDEPVELHHVIQLLDAWLFKRHDELDAIIEEPEEDDDTADD